MGQNRGDRIESVLKAVAALCDGRSTTAVAKRIAHRGVAVDTVEAGPGLQRGKSFTSGRLVVGEVAAAHVRLVADAKVRRAGPMRHRCTERLTTTRLRWGRRSNLIETVTTRAHRITIGPI